MKRLISVSLTLLMLLGAYQVGAFADAQSSADVFVTISDDKGALALAQEKITVTDIDGDNALTINDALYCAHEAKYKGGAASGYISTVSAYGISLDMLWGVANGGSYGYYINNISAWNLTDTVKDGDYLNAYCFTDLDTWSDMYTYFDMRTAEAEEGQKVTLTLSGAGFDESFAPITVAVSDATITVDGKATEFKTDKDGKVTVTLDTAGTHIISATSKSQTLVPPVCIASVAAKPTETPSTTVAPTTQAVAKPTVMPAKVKKVVAKSKKKRKVAVAWKAAKYAGKYTVRYSYKKNMRKAKTKTTKKLKLTLKKLKSGKKVYIQVRGVSGNLKGKWSAKASVKVK